MRKQQERRSRRGAHELSTEQRVLLEWRVGVGLEEMAGTRSDTCAD